jgi:hypothetical protein
LRGYEVQRPHLLGAAEVTGLMPWPDHRLALLVLEGRKKLLERQRLHAQIDECRLHAAHNLIRLQ